MSASLPQGQSTASTCQSVYDFSTFILSYLGDVLMKTSLKYSCKATGYTLAPYAPVWLQVEKKVSKF